ncbi:MAG: hypothetical protein KAX37_00640 [Opitutaceae bacterium]|nr:hypothetical protein [Opitutaceae bacterium]
MRVLESSLWRAHLHARMPFKYGIVTMTELPHVFLQVRAEFSGGATGTGVAADHLPPKWFTKDPQKDPHLEIDEMLVVIRHAMAAAGEIRAVTVFDWWRELYRAQAAWAESAGVPPLLAHFGTSLLERAVIDAFCRALGKTFFSATRDNLLGIDLGALQPELSGSAPRDWLPASLPHHVFARHTVGMVDPLWDKDVSAADRVDDGLPQSLEAGIAAYGLRHFKLKVGGGADRERLLRIVEVLEKCAAPGWVCTLDGNEGFKSVDAFRTFWEGVVSEPKLEPLRRGLLFVEQPFHRDLALSDEIGALASSWPGRPPIIIDESDATLESLPRALALGYCGTSHKNCKGVFKGLINACHIAHLKKTKPQQTWRMSGEDLSNVGPIAQLQDLAVQAALGITSVERNGHHYFAGLSAWPSALQDLVLRHHGDLYVRSQRGWPTTLVRNGEISVDSVTRAPFGEQFAFDPAAAGAVRI